MTQKNKVTISEIIDEQLEWELAQERRTMDIQMAFLELAYVKHKQRMKFYRFMRNFIVAFLIFVMVILVLHGVLYA